MGSKPTHKFSGNFLERLVIRLRNMATHELGQGLGMKHADRSLIIGVPFFLIISSVFINIPRHTRCKKIIFKTFCSRKTWWLLIRMLMGVIFNIDSCSLPIKYRKFKCSLNTVTEYNLSECKRYLKYLYIPTCFSQINGENLPHD